jgi:hypothetical protein
MPADFATLRRHLQRRLAIIADHGWRDTAPAEHLAALAEVSSAIELWHQRHSGEIPAQLRHFLAQASLTKALQWLDDAAPAAD